MKWFDIYEKTLSVNWKYEKFFWKLLPDLVYNQVAERYKNILYEVFWFKDIHQVFKKELLKGDTIDLIKIVSDYQDNYLKTDVSTPNNKVMPNG